jgi:hypothetical protein
MTYNHPKRDNCDRGSHLVPTVRMSVYVHFYLHKTFHEECGIVLAALTSAAKAVEVWFLFWHSSTSLRAGYKAEAVPLPKRNPIKLRPTGQVVPQLNY